MLRVTVVSTDGHVTLKLEGSLTGPWVHELERSWLAVAGTASMESIRIDLTDVGFVDGEGQALIENMAGAGVKLIAAGPMMKGLVADVLSRIRKKQKASGGGHHAA